MANYERIDSESLRSISRSLEKISDYLKDVAEVARRMKNEFMVTTTSTCDCTIDITNEITEEETNNE